MDYEDKFPDTYRDGEDREQRAVEARGEVQEEVHAAAHMERDPSQQHQETTFTVEQARPHMEGDVAAKGGDEGERAIGDFIGHPMSEQEPGVTADEATDAPVSLLSQKHMFWFPSEAFQDDVTQRDSAVQSEESKENESQELNHSQKPIRPDDLEDSDRYVYHDTDDHDDHHEGHHDADDEHQVYDDHSEPRPPTQHEDLDRRDHPRNEDNTDDHYDMGEHDEDHGQIRYDGHDYDERDDAYNEHESYEDHEDVTEDHGDEEPLDDSLERPDHEDNEDDEGDEDHYNQREDDDDHYTNTDDHDDRDDDHDAHDEHNEDNDDHDHDHGDDGEDHDDDHNDHDDHDHNDRDDHDDDQDDQHPFNDDDQDDPVDDHDDLSDAHHDNDHDDDDDLLDLDGNDDDHDDDDNGRTDQDGHHDNGDHKDGDHNSYEDQASQEDVKDSDYHVIFSITRDHRLNLTEMADGGKATTDETWLDGYPVVATETENRDSLVERSKDEGKDMGVFNEVQSHKPGSHISLPDQSKSPSKEPVLEQAGGQKLWPGFIPTTTPTSDREQAPTYSWINDLTQQSFANHDPAPLEHDGVTVMEDHTMHNLPGESGKRGEMEGEMGEMGCTGENCPPPASSGQSPKVAAIIVVVCLVVIAVMVGVWCYRRQQQKSSVYEMNGKGQSQSRPAQQMEMQQKV